MKKLMVALLMAGLFTFTLGCGGGDTKKSTSSTSSNSTGSTTKSTESTEKK